MGRFLFYIEQPYSYSILRPLQEEIRSRGDSAAWFLAGKHVSRDQLKSDELLLESVRSVREFDPQAVFVPGNVVPDFFPGLKVQVFHGLEWKKKGHFAIRGFFDLYCTHGPITTERFDQLAERHRSFRVIETGWPKLDPYLGQPEDGASTPPTVVYAPTFSPSLSSASALLPELTRLARAGRFRFQVKFHPKMERSVVEAYRGAAGEGLEIAETQDLLSIIRGGSVVLSDTSSAVTEALLLGKTVVTFRNAEPQACLIDFSDPQELSDRLEQALTPDEALRAAISDYIAQVHPWTDGNSSARVLDATLKAQALGVRRKPLNLVRKLKIRRQLGYFGLQLSGAASSPATQH